MILLYFVILPPSILSLRSFYLWTEYRFFFFLTLLCFIKFPRRFLLKCTFELRAGKNPHACQWDLVFKIKHFSCLLWQPGKRKSDAQMRFVYYMNILKEKSRENSYHCCVVHLNENCLWRWDSFFMSFFFLLRPSRNYNHLKNPKNYVSSITDFPS